MSTKIYRVVAEDLMDSLMSYNEITLGIFFNAEKASACAVKYNKTLSKNLQKTSFAARIQEEEVT